MKTPMSFKVKSGIELIAEERREQLEKHGRTIERDIAENQEHQLMYGAEKLLFPISPDVPNWHEPLGWDEAIWEKMVSKSYQERLIIAGALIAAEIDRIQASKHPEKLNNA